MPKLNSLSALSPSGWAAIRVRPVDRGAASGIFRLTRISARGAALCPCEQAWNLDIGQTVWSHRFANPQLWRDQRLRFRRLERHGRGNLITAYGTVRMLREGQSYSALPQYFRRRSVRLWPERRPLRCRDSAPCSRFSCAPTAAVRPQIASTTVDQG